MSLKYNIKIGQVYKINRSFSMIEIQAFATLSGDKNPIHLDEKVSENFIFKKPICHGMLVSSLFSNLIATNFPFSVYLNQTLSFKKPVFVNEEIEASVEITNLKKRILYLKTLVKKKSNNIFEEIAIDGDAIVMLNV